VVGIPPARAFALVVRQLPSPETRRGEACADAHSRYDQPGYASRVEFRVCPPLSILRTLSSEKTPTRTSRRKAAPSVTPRRPRAPRSDAVRNRQLIVAVAFEAFASEGLSVPVHEVARRAKVGTGTVSRHFPTKEALFEAVFVSRVERLCEIAQGLMRAEDATEAFFTFFAEVVAEGSANRGLAEALSGAGFDLQGMANGDRGPTLWLAKMLRRAQEQGNVRPDVDIFDVKALIIGCLAREQPGRDRMISLARCGLLTVEGRGQRRERPG